MPQRLDLHFLGPPQIHLNDEPIALERRKMLALLAYLALERGQHQRASLSALLWPDYEQSKAYKNLRQTLWEIQQAAGEGWLVATREKIGLNEDANLWLDIREFDSLLEKSRSESDVSLRTSLLADSAKLYRNHFLTGFSLKDAYPFNEWAYSQSEDLRHKLSETLTTLSIDYCSLGQASQAIPHARRLVSLDPLDESAHRQLMEVYIQAGQHNAALKQYQTLEQTLRKELNLDPQPETRDLYKKIRKGDIKPVPVKKQVKAVIPSHNLPHNVSSFIGRDKEQTEIKDLIHKNRLVTLVGAGGIGKTSLALQIGHAILNEYPNGVWFIALDSLADPALTTQTVASIFNVREGSEHSLVEMLCNVLREQNALLVFDNCEHLLGACTQLITTLLTNCPDLKVLATSREALGLSGEAVFTMPSLPLPETDEGSLETLSEYETVRLFAERAALASNSFQLKQENIQTVVEICRKVDGIPLAIELAAARVNILQVDEILNQLNDSFTLLVSDGRTILPRHQTIQASLDWSWGLLGEDEQNFLKQLSVFAGGWTLESAQAVCNGEVLGLTGSLVNKSLVVVDQEAGRETRYRFHEMVRQFVSDKAHQSDNMPQIQTRHLNYFLKLSEIAESELRGLSRVDWMESLNDERNNLRAALQWAYETDLESGLFLTGRLRQYWESLDLREGVKWCEKFLDKTDKFPLARANALLTYGWLQTWLQDFTRAREDTEESLKLFRAEKHVEGEIDSLILLGNIEQFFDDLKSATKLFNKALKLSEKLNDRWRMANAYTYLGWDNSDHERKFANWEKAIRLLREVGDKIALANLLGVVGQFRVLYGDIELGEKFLDEAMQMWESNKKANVWENPRIARSLIALIRGEYERAKAILAEVLISAEQSGNRMSYLWGRVRLGHVALHAGDLVEARQLLTESASNFNRDGYSIGTIYSLEGMANLYATIGKTDYAVRLIGCVDTARELVSDVRFPLEQADVDMSTAACIARMGEPAYAEAYAKGRTMTLNEAVELVQKQND